MRARTATSVIQVAASCAVAALVGVGAAWAAPVARPEGQTPAMHPKAPAPVAHAPAAGPLASEEGSPWPLRPAGTPYHGDLDKIAFGVQGELRFAEDRIRGVSKPEWFSVGRLGGFATVRVGRRLEFAGNGAYDQGTDDFSMEQIELRFLAARSLMLHAGVFLVPLGRTNLEHEAPPYEFAERSLPATQIVGVPNAQLGVGLRGVGGAIHGWPLSYEVDLVTGYDEGLIMEAAGGTRVPMGRNNYGDKNGIPAIAARLAAHPSQRSEIGFAAQSGQYNQTVLGGVKVDHARYVHVLVADATSHYAGFGIFSEAAMALIDVPPGLEELYAEKQWGASVELTRTLFEPIFGAWTRSELSGGLRADAVDLDRSIKGDSRSRLSASLNFRRIPLGVIRLGWYYELARDRFNNLTPKAGVTITTAAYF